MSDKVAPSEFTVSTAPGLTVSQSYLEEVIKTYENFLEHPPNIKSIEEIIELSGGWLTIESQADMNLVAPNVDFGNFTTRVRARVALANPDCVEVKLEHEEAHLMSDAGHATPDPVDQDLVIIQCKRPKPAVKRA